MKKRFFFMALSALALASCSNDEMIDVKQNNIKVSATTAVSTRAGAVSTTTNNFGNFKLWAYTTDTKQLYIEKEFNKFDSNGNSDKNWNGSTISTPYFWPDNSLSFYAVSPSTTTVNFSADAQVIENYVPDGATDLLYAVNKGESENETNTAVSMNFRHALAQLVFRARNENNYIGVDVVGVRVAQVYSKNTLTLTGITDNTNTTSTEVETPTNAWGVWGSTPSEVTTYEAEIKPIYDLSTLNRPIFITKNTEDSHYFKDNSYVPQEYGLYVLPQALAHWNPSTDSDLTSATTPKAYFLVKCRVWNKPTGEETVNDNPIFLWGDAETYKEVAIPVVKEGVEDAAWKQGKKYAYTFVFGEGAGYVPPTDPNDPDADPDEEDIPGDPVLVPIDVTVSVDDFQNATDEIVNM